MSEAEIQETLREKVRTLEAYMVDIAQTVIKDSEQSASDADGKTPSAFRYCFRFWNDAALLFMIILIIDKTYNIVILMFEAILDII